MVSIFIAITIFFINTFAAFSQDVSTNQIAKKYFSFPDRSISFYEFSEVEMFSLDLNTQNENKVAGVYQQDQATGLFYVHVNTKNGNKKYLTLKNDSMKGRTVYNEIAE
jgi:hypothetical protein